MKIKMKPKPTHSRPSNLLIIAFIATVSIAYILLKSNTTSSDEINMEKSQDSTTPSEIATSTTTLPEIVESKVRLSSTHIQPELDYYQCISTKEKSKSQVILLHGAAFTKQDWYDSGILHDLCKNLPSVTALDLTVKATSQNFMDVYQKLVKEGVLRDDDPIVVISPSASGKAIVDLASMHISNESPILKAWVPVACPAIRSASQSTLKAFASLNIPLLAIFGDEDSMGKDVTKKLVEYAGAEEKMLKGRHPVYLDSPKEFVEVFLDFIKRL